MLHYAPGPPDASVHPWDPSRVLNRGIKKRNGIGDMAI